MDSKELNERLELWKFKREGARDILRIINCMDLKSKKKKDIINFLKWIETLDTLEFDAILGEYAEIWKTPEDKFIVKIRYGKE